MNLIWKAACAAVLLIAATTIEIGCGETYRPVAIPLPVTTGNPSGAETEVVLPLIKNDFVELLSATAESRLDEITIEEDERSCVTVMMVSGGYPGNYEKGFEITGLEKIKESVVFHAGTAVKDDNIVTAGGRVLCITSLDNSLAGALVKSYAAAKMLRYDYAYYRKDIGQDLIKMEKIVLK